MNSRRTWWIAACVILCVLGCSDRTSRRFVFGPGEGTFTLRGRVRLVEQLMGETLADSLGYATIDDASGVRVRLLGPDGVTDSTLTRDGAFEFRVDDPGLYRVACALFPGETLCTARVTLDDEDTDFPDTLTFTFSPTLNTYPNPFPTAGGLAIDVASIPTVQDVRLKVMTLAGETIFTNTIPGYSGYYHYHWFGWNDAIEPQPNGLYWVTLEFDGQHHIDLVRKE
jgi:hypothetical protein